jgi:hypothetical protein
MIFPWHTDLFQPGRMVCVVFRASPLIWPTLFGAHHAPRPLCLRATRCTPGGFPRGAMGVGVATTKAPSSRTASADPGPRTAKSTGAPALRCAAAGKTGLKIKRTLRSALVPILVTQPLF